MTIEEAIERLEGRRMTMSMIGSVEECKKENEAIEMAVSALKIVKCDGCQHGEEAKYLPDSIYCKRFREYMDETDFCSHGCRKEELENG